MFPPLSIQNQIPSKIIVIIILTSQVNPNPVSITAIGETSSLIVCTPSIAKLEANTATRPIPVIFENFALNVS